MDALAVDFLAEVNETFIELSPLLSRISKTPDDREVLHAVFRHLHSIKGACSFLDYPRMQTLCHHGEEFLSAYRDENMTLSRAQADLVVALFRQVQFLSEEVEVSGSEPDGDDHALITLLKSPSDGEDLQVDASVLINTRERVASTITRPIGDRWISFPAIVEDLAMKLNKKIALTMEGQEIEVSDALAKAIKAPLMHMLRNACDHGIEAPDERAKKGKAETGEITLKAFQEEDSTVITLCDDGKGLDVGLIRQAIVEKGLASKQETGAMSDQDAFKFIFNPGFSTAQEVSEISGRGVGMDVVAFNIQQIGGTLDLETSLDAGSCFTLKVANA